MKKTYKIEITLTKNNHENLNQPYHWVLFSYQDDFQNEAAGWAASPEKAWKEAYEFFTMYKQKEDDNG